MNMSNLTHVWELSNASSSYFYWMRNLFIFNVDSERGEWLVLVVGLISDCHQRQTCSHPSQQPFISVSSTLLCSLSILFLFLSFHILTSSDTPRLEKGTTKHLFAFWKSWTFLIKWLFACVVPWQLLII